MKTTLITLSMFYIITSVAQDTNLTYKRIIQYYEYKVPICKKYDMNCLGFAEIESGPDAEVSSLIIKGNYVYILDTRYLNVAKMDLTTGKIVAKSKTQKEEIISCLYDLFCFDDSLYFVSDCTGYLYRLSENLTITKTDSFPIGPVVKIVFFDETPYIVHEKIKNGSDTMTMKAYQLNTKGNIKEMAIKMSRDSYWDDTLIGGNKVSMYTDNNIHFLKTEKNIYQIPEIIPNFDYWERTVSYSNRHLVYSVRKADHYRFVVCHY